MTPLQMTLLGISGSATIALLLLWVKRADQRRTIVAQEREQRIARVVERYGELARRLESTNLRGMLKAGVLGLANSDEVAEVLRRIDAEGLTPGIPGTYRVNMEGVDLLVFFRLLHEQPEKAMTDAGVRELIEMAKGAPGA
jgi:hypothetical protein